jgi:hypothetical protein
MRSVVPAAIRQPIRHKFLSNKIEAKPEFSPDVKRALWRLLEDDVASIEGMLGRRLVEWRQGYTD